MIGDLQTVMRRYMRLVEDDHFSMKMAVLLADELGADEQQIPRGSGLPWGDEYMGGQGFILTMPNGQRAFLDATIENGTIYLSQISVEDRASGLGTRIMEAIHRIATRRHYRVMVYKVTNHAFFDRFDWLTRSRDGGSYTAVKEAVSTGGAALPSNLNDAFWRWFGKSQVVDSNGKPLMVFHGTGADIKRFDLRGKFRTGGKAYFFTPDPIFAELYANKAGSAGRIYPVYLRIINMFDNNRSEHIDKLLVAVDAILQKEEAKPYGRGRSFYPFTKSKVFERIREGRWDFLEHPIIIDALKKAGFDGATISEGPNHNYMVFSANQIKSTLNSGDWDVTNPNIAESRGAALRETTDDVKVWHVTRRSSVPRILRQGLVPRRGRLSRSAKEAEKAIYVFPDSTSLEDAMTNWLGDEMENESLSLLELTVPRDWVEQHDVRWEAQIRQPVPPDHIRVLVDDMDEWFGDYPGNPPSGWFSTDD